MAIFAIEAEEDQVLKDFIKQTRNNLEKPDIMKNPFNGFIIDLKDMIFLNIDPIYPNPLKFMFFVVTLQVIFFGLFGWWDWTVFSIVVVFFTIGSLVHTKYFFYYFLKFSLKKKGYKKEIRLMSDREIMINLAKNARNNH